MGRKKLTEKQFAKMFAEVVKKVDAKKSVYEENYLRMEKLGIFTVNSEKSHRCVKNPSYMDFVVEHLYQDDTGCEIYSLTHYFEQNGDRVCDPDMQVRVNFEHKFAEALTFQNANGSFHEVYPIKDGNKMINITQKKSQNSFLATWLKNLKNQGFTLVAAEKK